jgi:hypothetical protein
MAIRETVNNTSPNNLLRSVICIYGNRVSDDLVTVIISTMANVKRIYIRLIFCAFRNFFFAVSAANFFLSSFLSLPRDIDFLGF